MLPKSRRLPRRDFIQTKTKGSSVSTPYFSAVVSSSPIARFAVVTSTKLSKKAVVRNRLRRLIYSSLMTSDYLLKANVIFYPKPSMLKLSYAQIKSCFDSFLSGLSSQA